MYFDLVLFYSSTLVKDFFSHFFKRFFVSNELFSIYIDPLIFSLNFVFLSCIGINMVLSSYSHSIRLQNFLYYMVFLLPETCLVLFPLLLLPVTDTCLNYLGQIVVYRLHESLLRSSTSLNGLINFSFLLLPSMNCLVWPEVTKSDQVVTWEAWAPILLIFISTLPHFWLRFSES